MKLIKLTGRELAVLRAIETLGSTGAEIYERTQIAAPDLADILNGMCEVGYVEAYRGESPLPMVEQVKAAEVLITRFEVNPSYALELKKALARR
jgi:hypothetical protein